MDQNGSSKEGNEGSSLLKKGREPSYAKWVFTWHVDKSSETDHLDQCKKMLHLFETYTYCFQLERGDETGKLHWQGYVKATARFRFKDRWGKHMPGVYCEQAMAPHDWQQKVYCNKDQTCVGMRHTNIKDAQPSILKHIALRPLRKWQQELLDLLKTEPNCRTVNWIWSDKGNIGKTDIACEIEDCVDDVIVVTGKAWNAHAEIASYIEGNGNQYPTTVVLDCERGMSSKIEGTTMESIKNGRFTLTKGSQKKRTRVIMPSPHLIVFANEPPEMSLLSEDRWNIIEVS